jgi:hypothetical protein
MQLTHGSILAVFFSASQAEVSHGADWYRQAFDKCCFIGSACGVQVRKVVGVLAALSPNNRWERNLADTETMCKLYGSGGDPSEATVATFGANKQKASAILNGADPLNVLGGLKVRAFFECVMGDFLDNDNIEPPVCVDGHAYAIWLGQRVPTTQTPKISEKLYSKIAEDYRIATAQINVITGRNLMPCQVQAITWVAWRNLVKNYRGEE